jgi:hypothetical protein
MTNRLFPLCEEFQKKRAGFDEKPTPFLSRCVQDYCTVSVTVDDWWIAPLVAVIVSV